MARLHLRFAVIGFVGVLGLASSLEVKAQTAPPFIDEKLPDGSVVPRAVEPPLPILPDRSQRSGLITRSVPITPHLPPDPDRDLYYNTRWNPRRATSSTPKYPNNWFTSGLYGLRLKQDCTACYSPYFQGSPGQSTLPPNTGNGRMRFRMVNNFLHPFQPISYYYAGGCYVPVYQLDPTIPGVNGFPYGVFWKRTTGG